MADIQRHDMRIAVLAGGTSAERGVSLSSGANVANALRKAGYGKVDTLDPATDTFLDDVRAGSYDAAFIALHGVGGEDGTVQHILEYLGIPYTGSDALASGCGMDKELSKVLYDRAGIPTARGMAIERGETWDAAAIVEQLGSRLFVKPAYNGSSYGVSKVDDVADLDAAIEQAFEYDTKILVEECLVGTEISVGVFGGDELVALPIVEICCPDDVDFYDLSVKYVDPKDIHRIPARLSEADYERAQQLAKEAHDALGCYGISRSDFIVGERGPVILETNTIPGMTESSLFPDEVRHAGLDFANVCAELVELALARADR